MVKTFPEAPQVDDAIPAMAKEFLEEAHKTLSAPNAASMVAGSAVDAMLKEKGYVEGSLYDRIDKAVADRVLTEDMGKWAHSVRLGANRPRHADKDKPHVSPEGAKRSVEFAEALGDFLFVLTARIAKGLSPAASDEKSPPT